jgi:hypothetical protein
MNANLRAMVVFGACGLAACTTQEVSPDGGGPAGSSGGGSTGAGGSGGAYPLSDGVACHPVTMALITDFTYTAGGAMDQIPFGDATTSFSGGQYAYPPSTSPYPVLSNVTGSNWHITGTVGTYSGFGLYFTNCNKVDATGYRGVSFTISGTVQGGSVTFEVDTLRNAIAPSWIMAHPAADDTAVMATDPGQCVPSGNPVNKYAQTDCVQPTKAVPVAETAATQTVLWADFTNGRPSAAPDPSHIVGIRWLLPVPTGVDTPTVMTYPVDLVIDDLKFVQ